MNLRDIEYILAAAEIGSFAKAARVCHISQPSLSIQIKKVEELLGCALFIRDKKGVRLSEFGETVLSYFKEIQDNVSKIHTMAQKQRSEPLPTIRLGAIATAAPYIFPYITDIENLVFEESTTVELIKKLLDDEIDAALLALPVKVPLLTSMSLYKEPFYLVAAQNNPYAQTIDVETIALPPECRFLVLSEEHCMGEQTMSLCKLNRNNNHKIFKATSLETIRHMVATSNDITLMPALARRHNDGLSYYDLSPRYHRDIGLVYKARTRHTEQIHNLHAKVKTLDCLSELKTN